MAQNVTVTIEQTSVSMLVWRLYRKPVPGLVELIIAANVGIADAPYIPVGTTVYIPDPPSGDDDTTTIERAVLW